jgi:peptidoglycan/LPS O-acetylase OafA/YrhL
VRDPYARWCGRGEAVRPLPIPIMREKRMENISKYRTELMGVSVLWIIFFHSKIYLPDIFLPLRLIFGIGYAGVDIFFLLSGLGLAFSISKDNSLMNFYWKRVIRIAPTYWTCLLLMLLPKYFTKQNIDVHAFLFSLFGLDFFVSGNLNTWFIPSIMACYVIFPGLHVIALKYGYGLVSLLFSIIAILASLLLVDSHVQHLLIFTIRVPVFIFGSYVGFLLINKKKCILDGLYLNGAALFLSIIMLCVIIFNTDSSFRWSTGLWWYPTIVMAFPIAVLIGSVLDKVKRNINLIKLLRGFGLLSLEIYLIHSSIFELAEYFPIKHYVLNFWRIPEYIFYVVVSFVLSKLVNLFLSKMNWELIHNVLFQRTAKSRSH